MRRRLDRGSVTSTLERVELVAEDLRPAAHAGQRCLQVVGHGAGEGLELAAVGALLGDVVDDERRPAGPPVGLGAVQRHARRPRGSPAARSRGRCAAGPRGDHLARAGRGCGGGRRASMDGAVGQEEAVVVGRVPSPAGRRGCPSWPRRPGCASSPVPDGLDHDEAVGHRRSSPRRAARRARWPGPRTRRRGRCRAARSATPEGEHQHEHGGDQDVDLDDDGPGGEVLDRAERSAARPGCRAPPGSRRPSRRHRRRRGRTGSRSRSQATISTNAIGSCSVGAEQDAGGAERERGDERPARAPSGGAAPRSGSAAQPRRAWARNRAVSRASTEATTTKVLQVLRTTQAARSYPGRRCRSET